MSVGAVFGVIAAVFLALVLLYFGIRFLARLKREREQEEGLFNADLFKRQSGILDEKRHSEPVNYGASGRDSHSRPSTWYNGDLSSYPRDHTDAFVSYDVFARQPPSESFNAAQGTLPAVPLFNPLGGQPPMRSASPDAQYNSTDPAVHYHLSDSQHGTYFTVPDPTNPAYAGVSQAHAETSPAADTELPRQPPAAHWQPHLRADRNSIQVSPFADPPLRGYYDEDTGSILGMVLYTSFPDEARGGQAHSGSS